MENSENIAADQETTTKVQKYPLKYKKDKNGLFLTIHHTIKENDNLVRIRLVVGCFNDTIRHFITIDNRGNIFVFDLINKKYWRLADKIPKACIIRNVPEQQNLYLIGSKIGRIYWLDIDKSSVTRSENYSNERILNISFPGIPLTPLLAVVHSNYVAILINMCTYEASHRLEFNQAKISLKYVAYVPQSDQIFTCFTNDSVHIWSGITLNTIRVHNPIRIRDRHLRTTEAKQFRLNGDDLQSKFEINCDEIKEFSKGLINSYTFSSDGSIVCFTTLDNYILVLSSNSYEILKLIKVLDATLNACWLFPKPNDHLFFCQTTKSQLFVVDVENFGMKLIVEDTNCFRVDVSRDKDLLYAIKKTGEANIYSVCALMDSIKSVQNCVELLKKAMSQPKALSVGCFDNELRKMLNHSRLIPILKEYGQYPSKYRNIIWTALLDIPCNKAIFMQLVKMGTHPNASLFEKNLQLKNATLRRNLIKIFSCLGHWTRVFVYSEFLPAFIFPFIKIFSNNVNVCFEILATIIINQCQLWFEFHPLEPLNYLGMCENILNHFCPQLTKFYTDTGVTAKEYAWTMLANGFSEVLDEDQWLWLWDNILSSPPYFLIFCVVAYNVVQKEIIIRMTNKEDLAYFFHDQNAVDLPKVIKKANLFMETCPVNLHPRRYMKEFEKLPKGVYPKFQNYPKKWVEAQESELDAIRKEHELIDARMRKLEQDEAIMMDRLERGLKQEEQTKRMKEMQRQYQEILKREEERVAYQRKILLLYQKELRQRKGKVVELLEESARRRKQNLQECELDSLLRDIDRGRQRNEMDLAMVEEDIKNHEMNLISHRYGVDDILTNADYEPMRHKFKDAIDNLAEEKRKLSGDFEAILRDSSNDDVRCVSSKLSQIESTIQGLEKDFEAMLKCKS